MQLMQLGIQQTIDNKKPKEPVIDDKELTIEEKHDALAAEFKDYKDSRETKDKQRETLTALAKEIDTLDVIKEIGVEIPEAKDMMIEAVRIDALARQVLNPRLTLADATRAAAHPFQKVFIQLKESFDKKMKSNDTLRNSMGGIIRGGSGVPALDTDHKYTVQDIKDGTARRALEFVLEGE